MGIFDKLSKLFSGPAPEAPPASRAAVPEEWGWYRMHVRGSRKALGYYYVDRTAGPSFKIVVELDSQPTADEIRKQAAAAQYRGSSTFRLPGFETVNTEGLPEDFAALMRKKYEECEGPGDAILLKLTQAERAEYGLPETPEWVGVYF